MLQAGGLKREPGAGDLRDQVTIQQPQYIRTATGGQVASYDPPASSAAVWALVEEVSGEEAWWGQQRQAVATFRVTIRHRTDVTERWRVVFGSRALEVAATIPLGNRKAWLALLCVEIKGRA